jgi:excisionase family DNA binding protein
MKVEEAADYLRISTRKMRHLQSIGEVKHSLVGTRIIFRREDLDRYAEKNSVFN